MTEIDTIAEGIYFQYREKMVKEQHVEWKHLEEKEKDAWRAVAEEAKRLIVLSVFGEDTIL